MATPTIQVALESDLADTYNDNWQAVQDLLRQIKAVKSGCVHVECGAGEIEAIFTNDSIVYKHPGD